MFEKRKCPECGYHMLGFEGETRFPKVTPESIKFVQWLCACSNTILDMNSIEISEHVTSLIESAVNEEYHDRSKA